MCWGGHLNVGHLNLLLQAGHVGLRAGVTSAPAPRQQAAEWANGMEGEGAAGQWSTCCGTQRWGGIRIRVRSGVWDGTGVWKLHAEKRYILSVTAHVQARTGRNKRARASVMYWCNGSSNVCDKDEVSASAGRVCDGVAQLINIVAPQALSGFSL